jgi:hypothetical protein
MASYLPPPPQPPQPGSLPKSNDPTAGGGSDYSRQRNISNARPITATKSTEEYLREKASGISKPALLGYITAGLIFVFGGIGTMFNDDLDMGGIKKNIAGGYTFAAVALILLSSMADSADKISRRQ